VTALLAVSLTVVLLAGLGVVMTHDPAAQCVVLGVFGLSLGVLFMVVSAPDVALSQIAVGTVVLPLMVLLAVRRAAQHTRAEQDPKHPDPQRPGSDRDPS